MASSFNNLAMVEQMNKSARLRFPSNLLSTLRISIHPLLIVAAHLFSHFHSLSLTSVLFIPIMRPEKNQPNIEVILQGLNYLVDQAEVRRCPLLFLIKMFWF